MTSTACLQVTDTHTASLARLDITGVGQTLAVQDIACEHKSLQLCTPRAAQCCLARRRSPHRRVNACATAFGACCTGPAQRNLGACTLGTCHACYFSVCDVLLCWPLASTSLLIITGDTAKASQTYRCFRPERESCRDFQFTHEREFLL